MKLACAIALIATPIQADVLGLIDYEQIFTDNAADVETSETGSASLSIGETIVLQRTEAGVIAGFDTGANGAAGCFIAIVASVDLLVQKCGEQFAPDQIDQLSQIKSMALNFYADNTASDLTNVNTAYDALIAGQAEGVSCEMMNDFASVTNWALSAEKLPEIEAIFAEPRLPVSNPCF